MAETKPFNPLEKRNLAASIAEALLERDPVPLGTVARFNGTGVYAIYYTVPHPAYAPLADANREGRWWAPIYVGKPFAGAAAKAWKFSKTKAARQRGRSCVPV